MQGITVDNVYYNVRVRFGTLQRSFEVAEGQNTGTALTLRMIRDIIGTRYTYQMEVEPAPGALADYDAFYEIISAPVTSHEITVPYGQSTMTFEAAIESGTDTYQGRMGGERWGGLTVQFHPITPQRTHL